MGAREKLTRSNQIESRFIGLRWKSLFWLSLLLLCMSSVFYALNYHSLMTQFQARQDADISFLRHHIKGLFTGTSDRLMRLGGGLATMKDLGDALRSGSEQKKTDLVSNYYASLGYELDMRQIELYTTDGTRVGRWAQFGVEDLPSKLYKSAVDKVQKEERPFSLLHCHPLCLLYAFVPVLASGENVGVIALGQSVADFIIDFKLITGADIALAVPSVGRGGENLDAWNVRMSALTETKVLLPLLNHLSEQYPDPAVLDHGRMVSWKQAHYDIHRIQLDSIIPGQAGFILLVTDVSRNFQEINKALQQGLLATLISLLVAELILLYLIRVPLHRLSQLALHLPLLAQGSYELARQYFSSPQQRKQFRDEIDFLYESAMQLSHQLEQKSLSIASKNRELAEERDFIQGLLASAQVLVVTQTKNGVIRVGNNFAAQLTGFTQEQLYGKRFVDLIADPKYRQDVQNQIQALCNNDQRQMEHEHDLISKNGERRKVVWVHTPLHEVYTDGTALLSVGMDITERVCAESRMRWLANHDPLTSLTNRHHFIEEVTRFYDEVMRTGNSAALLIFDLDHFKEINDTSGHAAGDALLRMVAEELKNRARKSDIVARLGGDEFAMLMPQTERYGAESFAKQLNERLAGTPFVYKEKRYRIGVSIGIAFLPEHGADIQEVMANADLAMFEAKRTGRSRARVFSEELKQSQTVTQNVYWNDVLIEAMEQRQLFFYYQPIINITTGNLVYTEALLRMHLSDGRLVMPGEFLPSAERAGLNYALDCYVVEIALQALLEDADKRLSINLSTAALNDFEWIQSLVRAIQQHDLDPKRMIFEITETAVIQDIEKAKQIIHEVTDLGFSFAVDDFGAGFSSLYYLKQLPVNYVKIDQSLIRDIANDSEDFDFVRALVSMVHAYGKKVVAEGVENEVTLKLLTDMHVDLVQGFYLGYPVADYGTMDKGA